MSRKKSRRREDDDNGFAEWGGYMQAKKTKLDEQFSAVTVKRANKKSEIFNGVSILVNGYTNPSADELKILMAEHGGTYHLYQNQRNFTTHIIATNLPNVKINQLGNIPIVNPNWITESIEANRLLDFTKYLLYTNVSRTQPKLNFHIIEKPKAENVKVQNFNIEYKNVSELKVSFEEISKDNLKNDYNLKMRDRTCQVEISNVQSDVDHANAVTLNGNAALENVTKYAKTAADPKFLSDFYNNSRLHLISTLGAELKQIVNEFREKSTGFFPGLEKLKLINSNKAKDATSNARSEVLPIVMHIDMDCFFVSVGLRERSDLIGKPVAVTHSKGGQTNRQIDIQPEIDLRLKRLPEASVSKVHNLDNKSSMAEIASCSYEARKCGIKNGMLMGAALKLCPNLIPIPYNFQGYREVSSVLYNTIAEYTVDIEAVSCDEMYVDVTKLLREANITVEEFASHIRNEITLRTGCPCSTGFGSNRLQARLATKKAKPNGQYYLKPEHVHRYMENIALADLPGVGWSTLAKLKNLGLKTCSDLENVPLNFLRTELGQKNSEVIYNYARGIDKKPLNFEHERKSVSADVNYGIRFKNNEEALTFIESLSQEVFSRLSDIKMKSKCLTLKLLIRATDAPIETAKYLGCGICDAMSRSITTNHYLENANLIYKEAKNLFLKLKVVPEDLRGVGIQLSKLEKLVVKSSALTKFLNSTSLPKIATNKINFEDKIKKTNVEVLDKHGKEAHEEQFEIQEKGENVKERVINMLEVSKKETNKKEVNKSKNDTSNRGGKKLSTKTKLARVGSSTSLENYFKSSKSDVTQVLKKKCNIDMNVLKELPEDLRLEIMKEYDLPKENTYCENLAAEVTKNTEKLNKNPLKQKRTFADLSDDDLRNLLRNWIMTELTPKEFDVDMLGDYLKSLAQRRCIDKLPPLLSFIHRHVNKMTCSWHDAYFKLVEKLQEGMLEVYRNPLLVPKSFTCFKH